MDADAVVDVVAAVFATALTVLGRLVYTTGRDVARLAQRVAYLEGTQHHREEP